MIYARILLFLAKFTPIGQALAAFWGTKAGKVATAAVCAALAIYLYVQSERKDAVDDFKSTNSSETHGRIDDAFDPDDDIDAAREWLRNRSVR